MIGTLIKIVLTTGKVIGGAKSLKNISDFVQEDREAKRRQKEKQEELKRQQEFIDQILGRNVIETFMIYVLGCAAGIWLTSLGRFWVFIVMLVYLIHINELYKISKSVGVIREGILTGLSIMVVIITMVIA
ncbi:MAG: hypothetical protein KHY41_19810 [Enterocloster sp.]|jgi:hypothetical protein|uniref:hypothetical protein n=1 Tax=Enterocloster TaxID=2719313 RepID=UPI00257A0A4D|nr:hypothetical protein [Enterocloster sp.]MBS5405966.1 hypothetical protein [Enterocloster sp.]